MFFGLGVQISGIYAVFSLLQEECFSCQRHKNTVNYSAFALGKQQKKAAKIRPTNCPKWTSETHLGILASFFPARGPQKRLNPSSLKVFWGAAAGARPRVAKASCMLQHTGYIFKGFRPTAGQGPNVPILGLC